MTILPLFDLPNLDGCGAIRPMEVLGRFGRFGRFSRHTQSRVFDPLVSEDFGYLLGFKTIFSLVIPPTAAKVAKVAKTANGRASFRSGCSHG